MLKKCHHAVSKCWILVYEKWHRDLGKENRRTNYQNGNITYFGYVKRRKLSMARRDPNGCLVHGPLDVQCKTKILHCKYPSFLSFALGFVPQCGQYWILSSSKACNLFTYGGSPRLLSSSFFCLLLTQRLLNLLRRKESQLNILAISENFARNQFSIVVHITRIYIYIYTVLGEQQPLCHKSDL
jgi:hypothetical protein